MSRKLRNACNALSVDYWHFQDAASGETAMFGDFWDAAC